MATDEPREDLDRLIALSDGVFAFAVTLLVVTIDLPPPGQVGTINSGDLVVLWPEVFSYVISFVVIAYYWVDHRYVFRRVAHHDVRVTWINTVFLMTIAFLPFPTEVLGEYGGLLAIVFYATSMSVTGFSLTLLWWYLDRGGFLVAGLDDGQARFDVLRFAARPLVFAASIPVAFVSEPIAVLSWVALFVVEPLSKRVFHVGSAS